MRSSHSAEQAGLTIQHPSHRGQHRLGAPFVSQGPTLLQQLAETARRENSDRRLPTFCCPDQTRCAVWVHREPAEGAAAISHTHPPAPNHAQAASYRFRETFQNRLIRGYMLAQAHEGADDEHAHVHGPLATQDVRRHQCTVFGKRPGTIHCTTMAAGTGRKIQWVVNLSPRAATSNY